MWPDIPDSHLLPGRLVSKAEKSPNARQLPPPIGLDSGFQYSPQLLPTASWKPAVSGGRKRTFCCGTSYSPSVWHSTLPISSCLSRRSPDWTCEVLNTVIQPHSLLANWRVRLRRTDPGWRDVEGLLFPLVLVAPHKLRGSLPTVQPCPQIHTESICTRVAFPAMLLLTMSQHQNKHHLIRWVQVPRKASISSNCFQRLNAYMCKTRTLISSSHYSINTTKPLCEGDSRNPVLKCSMESKTEMWSNLPRMGRCQD